MRADRPVCALLTELIDYAGLFPPAGLDMAAAVRKYASWLTGERSWIPGRFIVPAARREEFEKAAAPYVTDRKWKLGVLGMPGKPWDGRTYAIDAIELKADRIEAAQHERAQIYFEVPGEMEAAIDAIARAGARAKIRTGGLTADAFPDAARVARFLWLCHRAGVAFKATAGLHHPMRGEYPFTYEPASARGTMHGFVNVFLAAALIHTGISEREAAELLEERSPEAFRFDNESIRWRSHRLTTEQIRNARQRFAISFGSCSIDEPIHELDNLGLL
jgi:hypothetical protein